MSDWVDLPLIIMISSIALELVSISIGINRIADALENEETEEEEDEQD